MTQDEFIAKHRDHFAGAILEAMTADYRGSQLAVWTRTVFAKVDRRLAEMYADLAPKPDSEPSPTERKNNGQETTSRRRASSAGHQPQLLEE
jgi:hypothetical protein